MHFVIRLKLAIYKFEIGTGIFLFWRSISDAKSDVISRIESWQASVHSKSKIQRCPLYGTRHPSIAIFPSMVREKIGSDWSSSGRIPLTFVGVFLDLDLIRQQRQESVTQRIFTEMIPIEFNFRNVSWTIRTLPTKLEMIFFMNTIQIESINDFMKFSGEIRMDEFKGLRWFWVV